MALQILYDVGKKAMQKCLLRLFPTALGGGGVGHSGTHLPTEVIELATF
jgi:hypothetical protein